MKLSSSFLICSLTLSLSAFSSAAVIYTADFSMDGQGSTHDNTGSDPIEPSPTAGANWNLTYPSLPDSDSTTNEFVTSEDLLRVQDWGGEGSLTSLGITIPNAGSVSISGVAETIGSDVFNASAEGITWFYILNSGAPVSFFIGETELGGMPVEAEIDVGHDFLNVPVSMGDILEVGFTVNVNGVNDGVEISSLVVDFTPIPEPSAALLSCVALLGLLRRHR